MRLAVDVDFKKPQYEICRFLDAATTDINALAALTGALGSWFLGLLFGVRFGLWGLLYRADRYSVQGSTRERFFVENRKVANDQE